MILTQDIMFSKQSLRKLINSLVMSLSHSIFWCFLFLLVISFSKSQENSANSHEQSDNLMMLHDPLVSSTKHQNDEVEPIMCDSRESLRKNDDKMQYEIQSNSTKNGSKTDDSFWYKFHGNVKKNCKQNNKMFMEFTNSTEINSMLQGITDTFAKKSNSTSNVHYKNDNIDDYNNTTTAILSNKACNSITCIQLCCPLGENLNRRGTCVTGQSVYFFPRVFTYRNDSNNKTLNELYSITIRDPCVIKGIGRRLLDSKEYVFLLNGSLYQINSGKLILPTCYCLAILLRDIYDVIVCTNQTKLPTYISACHLVSLPFLLFTFVVYSILPELQNMHGYTLRAYVGSLFITYAIMYFGQQFSGLAEWSYCIPLAYIFNFSFLASFFWLNVTCFDIWWTFRALRLYQNVRQNKKKFCIYSFYAWGITLVLNVICIIMDYFPGIPKNLVRPEICKRKFWYSEDDAKTIYFYIPVGATIIINICFFIATTITLLCQNIRTAHQLRNSESERHNENTQRFKMYLKLFIVMGISWIMELISWSISIDLVPAAVWYLSDITNALQGVIIFIIFVCRKKIKYLLLKRFGGQICGLFCKIPVNNNSIMSSTSTETSRMSMQAINSFN
ncbi:G-protein coupled receptor Mth2-like [Cardiocondyla obscurior]|uniref:G-protein coupled receptor Mth2-like n=1 Tax=Cardiocondyla obscurior TaxID=286306 RepID=UPI0039657468